MPMKRARKHARKKHSRRRVLTAVAAAATATTMTLTTVTPAPKAEAATVLLTTQILDIIPLIESLFGFDIPLPFASVAANPSAIRAAMAAGGKWSGVFGLMDGAIAAGQAVTDLNANHPTNDGPYNFSLIRNPGRANGGFAARFDWLYSAIFGRSSISGNGAGSSGNYQSFVYDFGAGYDFFNDFPSNLNPVSIANSIAQAFLPINLIAQACAACAAITGNVTFLQNPPGGNGFPVLYVTIVPQYNALLLPLRIPGMITTVLGFNFSDIPIIGSIPLIGNPVAALTAIANAYEPAVDILINSGYNDVNTTNWTRSFSYGVNKLFFFDDPFPINTWLGSVQAAALSAAQNTVPLIQPLVNQVAAIGLDVFNAVVPVVQPIINSAITEVVNVIKSIIGAIIGTGVNPAVAAATLPAEQTDPTAQLAAPAATGQSTAPESGTAVSASSDGRLPDPAAPSVAVTPDATPASVPPAPAKPEAQVSPVVEEGTPNPAGPTTQAVTENGPTPDESQDSADGQASAQDTLDAAAQQARDRASDAQDETPTRVTSVEVHPDGVAPTNTAASDTTPADAATSQSAAGTASSTSGDAAA